jgi:TPR repeat protein
MSGTMPPPSAAEPGPAGTAVTQAVPEPESPDTDSTKTLALPAPPGGIGTVTSGGEGARTFLYEQRAGGARPDPDVVFAEAERRQDAGNLEDAYLLYRYAARHGQARAAMTLGTQADPAYHDTASSYLPEPEPGQALKWYSAAAEAGDEEAVQRLQALRARMEREAAVGDEQARRLLLQWR